MIKWLDCWETNGFNENKAKEAVIKIISDISEFGCTEKSMGTDFKNILLMVMKFIEDCDTNKVITEEWFVDISERYETFININCIDELNAISDYISRRFHDPLHNLYVIEINKRIYENSVDLDFYRETRKYYIQVREDSK